MASPNLGQLMKEAQKHPAILAAGLGAAGLAAVLAMRSSGGQADTSAETSDETDVMGTDTGAGTGGQDFYAGDPYAGGPGAGYDPFAFTDPYQEPTTPPDWYTNPPDWWKPPADPVDPPPPPPGGGTSPGGCPLPKPTLSPALVGKYQVKCVKGRWKFVPVQGPGTPPPPGPGPGPKPNVSAGGHVTFHGHQNARGHLVLDHRAEIHLAKAAHWTLGPAVSGDRTPGQHGGEVRVRKIIAAPGHAGQVGRYLKV